MNDESKRKIILKRLLFFIPIVLAVGVIGLMMRGQKGPERRPLEEAAQKVRIIRVQAGDVVPRAVGYGYVEPGRVWQVVPEVSGRIIAVSPSFKKGNFAKTGEVMLTIDPTDYRLAVRQSEADVKNVEAQLAELDSQEKNYRTSLVIQNDLLQLKKKELDRNQVAMKTRSISDSAFDQARMDYQSQLAQVQELENSLNLIPASRRALEAQLELNTVKLDEARADLERTEVIVPFNCRITSTSAEFGQYVQQGQTIAEADGTDLAEITAQVPMEKMKRLLAAVDAPPVTASIETMDRIKMDNLKKLFDLKVKIRLVNGDMDVSWNASFARADATIDSQTRTLGMIVNVDNPYGQIIVGKRPPLVRNMFCEVEISGRPITGQIVIPRAALHDGMVYVANDENRLERRRVELDFPQTDFCVIRNGLEAGERVVVSDLVPAVDGMLLEITEDDELAGRLVAQAGGRSEVK